MTLDRKKIAQLTSRRGVAIGRLLLLARRDFVQRSGEYMRIQGGPECPPTFLTISPYIDLEGTRNTELAQRAGISKQAVGKLVVEHEQRGLLVREADDADGRAWRVRLTPAGHDLLAQVHKAVAKVERDYEKLLGREGMQQLKAALQVIAYPSTGTSSGRD